MSVDVEGTSQDESPDRRYLARFQGGPPKDRNFGSPERVKFWDNRLRIMRRILTPLLILWLCSACEKKPEPDGYRVVGYDAGTHQWTIIRTGTFDGKYLTKRLTVICGFIQVGRSRGGH